MRWTLLVRLSLCFGLCFLLFTAPARPQLGAPLGRCGPRTTDPADWPANPSLEPSPAAATNPTKIPLQNVTRLQHDAKELADLSASLPADINQVSRGMLPRNVVERLKRIEKLAKRLRNQLSQ